MTLGMDIYSHTDICTDIDTDTQICVSDSDINADNDINADTDVNADSDIDADIDVDIQICMSSTDRIRSRPVSRSCLSRVHVCLAFVPRFPATEAWQDVDHIRQYCPLSLELLASIPLCTAR